jgi:hypothetical protein
MAKWLCDTPLPPAESSFVQDASSAVLSSRLQADPIRCYFGRPRRFCIFRLIADMKRALGHRSGFVELGVPHLSGALGRLPAMEPTAEASRSGGISHGPGVK